MAKNTDSDKRMAAYLKARGIHHGMRQTSTLAPPLPPMGEPGSAAYRRLMRAKTVRKR
jgi:hypothetical protein